jgi:hypothetical protein
MNNLARQLLNGASLAARGARLALRRPRSALLALRMAAWVAALSLSMRLMPLPRVLQLITPRRKRRPPRDAGAVQAKLAGQLDALLAIDFWVFTPTCWKRAPVLHRFLALRGIETRIVFGVRKDSEDALNGHAWLEAAGRPVLEKTGPDYTVTFSFPA